MQNAMSSLRWVSKAASSAPWLMLAPSAGYNQFYSVGEEKVFRLKRRAEEEGALLVGSSHGWVALYKEREHSVFLSDPITREHVKLPPLPDKHKLGDAAKLILTHPDPHHHDCRAALTFTDGSLALCAPARRSTAWTTPVSLNTIHYRTEFPQYTTPMPYIDFVYSRQLLCLVDHSRKLCRYDLEGWDLSDPTCPRNVWSEDLDHFDPAQLRRRGNFTSRQRYLVHVEHTDQLLQVTRYVLTRSDSFRSGGLENLIYPSKTIAFDVHVIDRQRRTRTYMEGSLGGLALFVGRNQALAVAAANFPGLQPDSIYFTDTNALEYLLHNKVYSGQDIGIFDYNKHTISSCYYPCYYGGFKKIHPAPLWFTPTPH